MIDVGIGFSLHSISFHLIQDINCFPIVYHLYIFLFSFMHFWLCPCAQVNAYATTHPCICDVLLSEKIYLNDRRGNWLQFAFYFTSFNPSPSLLSHCILLLYFFCVHMCIFGFALLNLFMRPHTRASEMRGLVARFTKRSIWELVSVCILFPFI